MQIGIRARVWWRGENDRQTIMVRRLRCGNCGKIHHELPDVLIPYKRYGADVVENTVNCKHSAKHGAVSAEAARRFRRWWDAVGTHFLNVLLTLAAVGASFGDPPAFREKVRAAVNSNNWVFAH